MAAMSTPGGAQTSPGKISAGLLMFKGGGRRGPDATALTVLLVHPGGPFFRNKDEGAWTIPKGLIEPGEEPLDAAVREFTEETGLTPEGPYQALTPIEQKGGKTVKAWAFRGNPPEPLRITPNTFSLEWPPGSGRVREFPEIDYAGFFTVDEARRKLNPAQVAFVEELELLLRAG